MTWIRVRVQPLYSAAATLRANPRAALRNLHPEAFKQIIARIYNRTKRQGDRMDLNGQPFESFYAFVQHKQWHGLGISYSRLQEYCKDDEQARIAVAEALPGAGEHGAGPGRGHKRDNNVTSFSSAKGNSADAAVRRLKRDRPDLADKVVNGEPLYARARAALPRRCRRACIA